MLPEDVYELTAVADPRLSADGTIAYVVTGVDREENAYRGAIWVAPVDGREPPKRLTAGTKLDASPRWSPDGGRLAFVSNRDGERAQLYVLPLDGGEPTKLTALEESVGEPAWAPDGSTIAFTARVRDEAYADEEDKDRAPRRFRRLRFKLDNEGWTGDRRRHVFIVPADGSAEPTQLTDGDFEDASPAWSPDGGRIVFTSARDEDWDIGDTTDLYLVDARGGEPTKLTDGDGSYSNASWSPDGARIACVWTPGEFDWPRHARIAVIDPGTGARAVLTEDLDRNCQPFPTLRTPCWSDAQTIVFGVEDRGNTHLLRARADGLGAPEAVVVGELTVAGFDARGDTVVTTRTTMTSVPELFFGSERRSEVGAALAGVRPPLDAERFTAISPDGTEVDGWYMPPAEPSGRHPVLLSIHGGPFTQYGNRFFDEFQVYARAGYGVVFSNPRGSSGFTEAWGRAIRGPGAAGPGMGTVDYHDVMAVVDEAVRRFPSCDPERLGVMGGSYGGYLTSWIVSHTDRFAAAISERAVNSWVSMWGSSDIGWGFKGYVGADLVEDHDSWRTMSPLTYAENIHTPLLILHSENDLRCNIEQAEQLFTTLRLLRRDVELVRFPGEGHELSRAGAPKHRAMRFEVVLEFLGRYLAP